jgi:hypothetical protein
MNTQLERNSTHNDEGNKLFAVKTFISLILLLCTSCGDTNKTHQPPVSAPQRSETTINNEKNTDESVQVVEKLPNNIKAKRTYILLNNCSPNFPNDCHPNKANTVVFATTQEDKEVALLGEGESNLSKELWKTDIYNPATISCMPEGSNLPIDPSKLNSNCFLTGKIVYPTQNKVEYLNNQLINIIVNGRVTETLLPEGKAKPKQ